MEFSKILRKGATFLTKLEKVGLTEKLFNNFISLPDGHSLAVGVVKLLSGHYDLVPNKPGYFTRKIWKMYSCSRCIHHWFDINKANQQHSSSFSKLINNKELIEYTLDEAINICVYHTLKKATSEFWNITGLDSKDSYLPNLDAALALLHEICKRKAYCDNNQNIICYLDYNSQKSYLFGIFSSKTEIFYFGASANDNLSQLVNEDSRLFFKDLKN